MDLPPPRVTRCSIATLGGTPFHEIDIRFLQLFDELPRVGRHAVEKAALPFREKNIERDRRFSGTAQTGDDHHLVPRNIERDILQIVLARTVDADGVIPFPGSACASVLRSRASPDGSSAARSEIVVT